MPKLTKKFIVFENEWEIFLYHPDSDDAIISEGIVKLFDKLSVAKEYAKENLARRISEEVKKIDNLKYSSFR